MAATQVQSMSPAEAAQTAFDSATKGAAEANGKVEFYAGQRRELEKQVAALTAKYNAACKSFAAGDGVDPQPARDELGRAESRLNGTIMLHEEGADSSTALHEAATTWAAVGVEAPGNTDTHWVWRDGRVEAAGKEARDGGGPSV
jgi:hypothetical protein